MAKYKKYDYSQMVMIPVSLENQLMPGTLEHTIHEVIEKKVSITEYFIESVWTNHYFICDYIEGGFDLNLTDEEVSIGMETVWKTSEEVMDIFENYETIHEHGPNVHNREFLGFINSI